MRPPGVELTYVSQQLPPAGEIRQCAVPVLWPLASYTAYAEVRTGTATLVGFAPLVGNGAGPVIPAKAEADPRATVRAAAALTRRRFMPSASTRAGRTPAERAQPSSAASISC